MAGDASPGNDQTRTDQTRTDQPAGDQPPGDQPAGDQPGTDTPELAAGADAPEVPEAPATWENVVVGEVKEAVGHAFDNDALVEEGREQVEIAHEVREEYREDHD